MGQEKTFPPRSPEAAEGVDFSRSDEGNRELADRALRLRGEPVTTVVPAGTRRLWETGTFARTFATLGGSLIITAS